MEKIKVIRKIEYKNVPVYIRGLDSRFEFLVFYNNRLYSEYFDIRPTWARKFLKEKYTKEQLDNIVKMVYFSACETIDALIDEKK